MDGGIRRVCVRCGGSFTIFEQEAEHLLARGLHHLPVRCKNCRQVLRDAREHDDKNFDINPPNKAA